MKRSYEDKFTHSGGAELTIFTPRGVETREGVVIFRFGGDGQVGGSDATVKIFTRDTKPEVLLAASAAFQDAALENLATEGRYEEE